VIDDILVLSGPQRKENVIFLKENYCPDSAGAAETPRRPATQDVEALCPFLEDFSEADELHQPEFFPPPDAKTWTDERSCESREQRQMLIDQIDQEIRWRSTQLHKLKRSAKGRILDCCDYFDGRKFTLQELKRRRTKLESLIDQGDAFEVALYGPTRRELRRPKSAPLHVRLAAYLDPIAKAGGGSWKACPSYVKLAEALGVCVESISQAFKKLEEDEQCPLAFACAYSGPTRCRQKHVALKSWLKFDRLPLHFEEEGRNRKLRPTFRKGAERIPPPPFVSARYGRKPGQNDEASRPTSNPQYRAGNSRFCLSDSIRLTPADKDNPQRLREKQRFRPNKPQPRKAVMSRSLENAAWRAAREAQGDGELFWDNAKPKIPLPALKTIILEAFVLGFEWKKHVRPALRFAIKEAHAAACLSIIRNPGAFATTIFREKIASMKPDLDHLDQVIEERRAKPAPPKPQRQRTPRPNSAPAPINAAPLPDPDPVELRKRAEKRAMDRLTAYIEANKLALERLPEDAAKDALRSKFKEFMDEETQ
jgi:hypothetical protein